LNLIDTHNNESLSHLLTKLDTQTSATSKAFECAPLGTNFVADVLSPSVVEVATRQLPITIHLSAKTELVDYLGKAYKKVLAIHKKLPPGGILVFVTGQREVEFLCRQLRKVFVKRSKINVKIQDISQKIKAHCRHK